MPMLRVFSSDASGRMAGFPNRMAVDSPASRAHGGSRASDARTVFEVYEDEEHLTIRLRPFVVCEVGRTPSRFPILLLDRPVILLRILDQIIDTNVHCTTHTDTPCRHVTCLIHEFLSNPFPPILPYDNPLPVLLRDLRILFEMDQEVADRQRLRPSHRELSVALVTGDTPLDVPPEDRGRFLDPRAWQELAREAHGHESGPDWVDAVVGEEGHGGSRRDLLRLILSTPAVAAAQAGVELRWEHPSSPLKTQVRDLTERNESAWRKALAWFEDFLRIAAPSVPASPVSEEESLAKRASAVRRTRAGPFQPRGRWEVYGRSLSVIHAIDSRSRRLAAARPVGAALVASASFPPAALC
ncbi:hypothetical protein DMC30DRAFT_390712 [Rhodotorula diobovata]|uniref:Uncharacterized protein n=1 Tax=Rhodotorula diobovata TaxID=5288 RepID=A0A5C5G340_9BASI|nr:hypothetical protein DMC30DRAFT_390712 [Rhodotorula diobovata]